MTDETKGKRHWLPKLKVHRVDHVRRGSEPRGGHRSVQAGRRVPWPIPWASGRSSATPSTTAFARHPYDARHRFRQFWRGVSIIVSAACRALRQCQAITRDGCADVAGRPGRPLLWAHGTSRRPRTGSVPRCYPAADPICIDDVGLLPVTTETAEALHRVVDAAFERRAVALSSNPHHAGSDELMLRTIADTTVDRLLHHAHIVTTTGDSIRLTQATTSKGEATRPMNPGSSDGHHRADPLSTSGQITLAIDSASGLPSALLVELREQLPQQPEDRAQRTSRHEEHRYRREPWNGE